MNPETTQEFSTLENTQVNDIIKFHGLTLTVLAFQDKEYIQLRPIVELLGLRWSTARRRAFFGDTADLLGTCELVQPEMNTFQPPKGSKKAVCIELEAAETYLMQTNTNRVRAHGNATVADYIKGLQIEWRKVLHDYETKGFAAKAMSPVDIIAKIDRIKDPELKRLAAEEANRIYGTNIQLGNQKTLALH